jgi:hypothetical protein
MSQQGPDPVFATERSKWAWRGLGAGAAFGMALMTFLLIVAGKRAQLDAIWGVLLAYALMGLLTAGLGAALGWFQGGTEAARQLTNRGQEVSHRDQIVQEAGMGFRLGLGLALLYIVVALGIFLEDRTFTPWLLALRAGVALVLCPAGFTVAAYFVALARPR